MEQDSEFGTDASVGVGWWWWDWEELGGEDGTGGEERRMERKERRCEEMRKSKEMDHV